MQHKCSMTAHFVNLQFCPFPKYPKSPHLDPPPPMTFLTPPPPLLCEPPCNPPPLGGALAHFYLGGGSRTKARRQPPPPPLRRLHFFGAVGSGTFAVHYRTALGQWAVGCLR